MDWCDRPGIRGLFLPTPGPYPNPVLSPSLRSKCTKRFQESSVFIGAFLRKNSHPRQGTPRHVPGGALSRSSGLPWIFLRFPSLSPKEAWIIPFVQACEANEFPPNVRTFANRKCLPHKQQAFCFINKGGRANAQPPDCMILFPAEVLRDLHDMLRAEAKLL